MVVVNVYLYRPTCRVGSVTVAYPSSFDLGVRDTAKVVPCHVAFNCPLSLPYTFTWWYFSILLFIFVTDWWLLSCTLYSIWFTRYRRFHRIRRDWWNRFIYFRILFLDRDLCCSVASLWGDLGLAVECPTEAVEVVSGIMLENEMKENGEWNIQDLEWRVRYFRILFWWCNRKWGNLLRYKPRANLSKHPELHY